MEQHRTLACIAEGESVRVRSLEMGGILRRRLSDLGLIPGTEVTCVRRGSGLAAYRICGAVIALRYRDASGILIE